MLCSWAEFLAAYPGHPRQDWSRTDPREPTAIQAAVSPT